MAAAPPCAEGRNVRAPPGRVPGNTRAGRPDGKCHRNIPPRAERGRKALSNSSMLSGRPGVRVKWCGKSAPAPVVIRALGKPHPEQGQIGGRPDSSGRGAWPRPRVGRLSPMVTSGLDRWPSPRLRSGYRTRRTGRLAPLQRRKLVRLLSQEVLDLHSHARRQLFAS